LARAVHLWPLAIALLVAAPAPAPAHAQDRTPTPTAHELWRAYPLRPAEVTPRRTATSSPTRSASRPAATTVATGSDLALLAVLAAAALVAASGAVLLVRRHRSRAPAFAAPLATAPRLALAGPSADSRQLLFSRAAHDQPPDTAPSEPRRSRPGVRPPDPDRRWTAEIQWTRSGDTARFCVVARDEQGDSEPVIARSETFDWPPEGTDAVQALVGAADALSEGLTVAGWTPLPRGEAWYAKRFEWEPAPVTDWAPPQPGPSVAPVESTRAPTHRFRPTSEWPAETEALWRCEITWRSGYARSRFEAVLHDPTDDTDARVIAASPPFKWLLMSDPDPNHATFREALRDLAAALESAGWERIGVGTSWYGARFVWHGDEPPPDEILVESARRAS
jgi:hypothetical protein